MTPQPGRRAYRRESARAGGVWNSCVTVGDPARPAAVDGG
jgi:hypothetical protein